MSRPIHFVGSVGGAKNVSSAMELMLRQRDHLLWLPDGEPTERSDYVRSVIDNLAARHFDQKTSSPGGSLENKAAVHPRSLAPLVRTLNAVIAAWPPNCSLDFLHIPVAWSDRPPSTDPRFYEPLTGLRSLPPQTQLFAGVVQCNSGASSSAEERTAMQLFEGATHRATGQPLGAVGVSCSCGTGRTEEWMMAGIFDRQLDIALHT